MECLQLEVLALRLTECILIPLLDKAVFTSVKRQIRRLLVTVFVGNVIESDRGRTRIK